MSLIYVMNASARCFSETSHKYRRKLCGNCAHVEFGLAEEECAFLIDMVTSHSSEVIWGSWIPQKGNVKKVGASQQRDHEKLRFVKILMTHIRYCPREKAWVSFIDQDCFRWRPRKNPSTKLWEWGECKVLRQAFMEYAKSISLITEAIHKTK